MAVYRTIEVEDGELGSNPACYIHVGAIDRTWHKIERPTVIPQRPFYSGHRYFHCFHTVVIVDNIGNLCYIHSGFIGHMNDALCLSNLPQVGPNTNLDFPDDCHLLVDLGYHCRYPLMTPYRRLKHLIKEKKSYASCQVIRVVDDLNRCGDSRLDNCR